MRGERIWDGSRSGKRGERGVHKQGWHSKTVPVSDWFLPIGWKLDSYLREHVHWENTPPVQLATACDHPFYTSALWTSWIGKFGWQFFFTGTVEHG